MTNCYFLNFQCLILIFTALSSFDAYLVNLFRCENGRRCDHFGYYISLLIGFGKNRWSNKKSKYKQQRSSSWATNYLFRCENGRRCDHFGLWNHLAPRNRRSGFVSLHLQSLPGGAVKVINHCYNSLYYIYYILYIIYYILYTTYTIQYTWLLGIAAGFVSLHLQSLPEGAVKVIVTIHYNSMHYNTSLCL